MQVKISGVELSAAASSTEIANGLSRRLRIIPSGIRSHQIIRDAAPRIMINTVSCVIVGSGFRLEILVCSNEVFKAIVRVRSD